MDAWLSWTVPIYWGWPNLSEFYPSESFIEVDITNPTPQTKSSAAHANQ